ncbi:ectoine synthase [Enhygromyxa salina]|uniref:L-ectoine synthase n=1 Tax=Enhygromyxa salina TaxID=215803 RepID=A0A120MFL6_9BACT|nr:ectoine synthase [Enhygromyxa salina]AMH38937.1 L ectoine synthase [Enhygromyxa salina]PRQ09315.1 L-ectoine synthase [Enhygromyxa salina]
MIVRRLNELPEDRVVSGETWISRRLLLRDEGMGFSLHDTLIKAGTRTEMRYANHLESVYCIEGEGTVTVVGSGEVIDIEPGTVYALDQHDEHVLEARTQLRMVCVFNPPLAGPEVHDATGAYPLID